MYGARQKYNDMYKEIKDFNVSKAEQNDIHSILQALPVEGKNSINVIPNDIPQRHLEDCDKKEQNEKIKNLQEQIAILKKERYSDQWVSQKTINNLKEKLENQKTKYKNICKLQKRQQMKIAKHQYSDVIKTLENKMLQAEDNFLKEKSLQQSLWLADKVTIDLLKEKNQKLESNLKELQENIKQKDENNQQMVQSLTEEVSDAKAEIQRLNRLNLNNEKRLNESEKMVNNITKSKETQYNEALDLIECAIQEKNDVLQREAKLVEQNVKLKTQLASIKDDSIKMQKMIKLKEIYINAYQDDAKKNLQNIEELKSALQEKETLLSQLRDRTKREKRSLKKKIIKVKHKYKDILNLFQGSAITTFQDFCQRNFGQTSSHTDSETCNKCNFELDSLKVQQLPEKITNLEEDSVILNDDLKQSQQQDPTRNVQDCIILADEKMKENDTSARLIYLENQLIDATNAKESLTSDLKSLQMTFDCEIRKRDDERYMLEGKIREMEMNQEKCTKRNKTKVQKSAKRTSEKKKNKSDTSIHPVQGSFQYCEDTTSTCTLETISTYTLDESIENINDEPESLLADKMEKRKYFDKKMKEIIHFVKCNKNFSKRLANIYDKPESLLAEKKKQLECFDEKMKEMNHYIKTYKNLSKRWTSETKALTEKFRVKFNELRGQMSTLKKKNVKLQNKLRLLNKRSYNNL